MQRFYFENINEISERLFINDKNIINQILKVLRAKIGDKFIFFDEFGDFIFELKNITKKEIVLQKIEKIEKNSEIDFSLNLFQALPNKMEKIEYIVQKGSEIGFSNFYFFRSLRSQKLNLSENKINRIKKIIIEACEQSGRNKIPNFEILDNLDLQNLENGQNIFFHTKAKNSKKLKDLKLDYSKKINLFIGPEGGFSDEEILKFQEKKFEKIFLGDRILRTETTGIVCGFFIIQNK